MTRQHGVVASAAGLNPFAHLSWGYRDRAEFLSRAAEYISDGLNQNQLVEYVGEGSRSELAAELAGMPGIRQRLETGSIRMTPATDYYPLRPDSDVLDSERAVANYAAAAERTISNGYTGFRAIVDATSVVRTCEQRDAMVRLEFLVDQQMAANPVSALCAYDLNQLGEHAAELICLHPYVNHDAPSFRLYAQPDAGFALSGEIDAATDELFTATLHRTWRLTTGDPFIIDGQDLKFISHHQLLALDQCARSDRRQVVLRTNQRIPTRLAGILDLTHLRVEPAFEEN